MYTQKAIEEILRKVSKRQISPQRAFQKLRHLSYESLQFAHLDHHRSLRKNLPEVIYAPGKTINQLIRIAGALIRSGSPLLITRLNESEFWKLRKRFPKLSYSKEARVAYFKSDSKKAKTKRGQVRGKVHVPVPFLRDSGGQLSNGSVAIVTGGTSDIPVAEEAGLTLEVMGRKVKRFYDLGVAGLHRLLDHVREIEKSDVIICIAGMEGALPSVLAGLVEKPIIAVPTSIGYGSSFKGVAPLLAMLNSCAQGVAIVNIDSGFSAACFAHIILNT